MEFKFEKFLVKEREVMEKEKKSTSLVTPEKEQTTQESPKDDKGVFDNLHKLREQIQAQKTLEKKLMEEEAVKAKRDKKLRDQINIIDDEEFEVDDEERELLEQELEAERSKVEFYENQTKELQQQLKQIEEDFSKIINLKYDNLTVIDRTKLDLSAEFLNALSNDFDESFVIEFNKLQIELEEIRKGYWEKEDADRKLLKQIEEFQRHYDLKQQEVLGLKKQIDVLEESVPQLKREEEQVRSELKAELANTKKQVEKLQKQNANFKAKVKELEGLVDMAAKETIDQLKKDLQDSQKLRQKAEQQKVALDKKLLEQKKQTAEIKKEIAVFKRKATIAENQLEKEKEQNQELRDEKVKPLQKEVRALEKQLESSNQKVNELQQALKENEKNIASLEKHKAETDKFTQTIESLKEDLQAEKTNTKVIHDEKNKLEKKLHALQEKYANLKADNESSLKSLKDLQKEQQATLTALKDEETQKESLKKEVIELTKELEKTINELDNVKNDTTELSKKEEMIQQLNAKLDVLHSQLVLKEEHIRLHQEKLSTFQQTIVSKEEDLYDLNDAYKKLENEVLQLKESNKSLSKQNEKDTSDLRAKVVLLEETLSSKEQAISVLKEEYYSKLQQKALESNVKATLTSELEDKVLQLEKEKVALLAEKESMQAELLKLKNDLANTKNLSEEQLQSLEEEQTQYILRLEDEIDQYKAKLEDLDTKQKEAQEQTSSAQAALLQVQDDMEAKDQEIAYLKGQINQVESELNDQVIALDRAKEEYERRLQNGDESTVKENTSLLEKVEQLENEVQTLEETISSKEEDIDILEDLLINKDSELKALQLQINSNNGGLEEAQKSINAKEAEILQLKTSLGAKQEALDELQSELEEKTKEIEHMSLEIDALHARTVHQEQDLQDQRTKLKVLEEKLQETLNEVTASNQESEKIVQKLQEKESELKNLREEKDKIVQEREDFVRKMRNLEQELANTHNRHREIIETEQKLYDNMIESYVNQIMQERKIHEEASQTYEEQVQMLEQILEEERDDYDREIRELRRDLEDKEYTISTLKRRQSNEDPQVKDEKYERLEKQFNELLTMVSRNNIYGNREFSSVGQMPAYSVYEEMTKRNTATQQAQETYPQPKPAEIMPEQPKQESNKEPDAYEKEIEALKSKIDSLFGKLEAQDKKEEAQKSAPVQTPAPIKVEDVSKPEQPREEPTIPEAFEFGSFSMDDMDEPTNQEELDELTELIRQKTTYIHQLLSDNHEGKLRQISDPNAQQRITSVLTMRKSITDKIDEEKSRYQDELEQISSRVNQKIADVYQIKTKLIKEEASFKSSNDFSKGNMDQFDNKKRQLLNDLQIREEELRMLREEDPQRVKTRYLSFLREKEAQLHKLLDEEDSILATFKTVESPRRSSYTEDVLPRSPRQETPRKEINRDEILKFDNVVKEEVEQSEQRQIKQEEAEVEKALDHKKQEVAKLKSTHAEYFEKLTTLRDELKKRKELEVQLRAKHNNIDEYVRLSEKYEQFEDQVHQHKEKLNELSKSMQKAQINKDRSEELKYKAAFMDQEILLQDVVSKKDYTKKHLEELEQQDEVKSYMQINDNIKKITAISKTYIEKLTGLKSEIQDLNAK